MTAIHLNWTDEQWDAWQTQTVTIPLDMAEALIDAVELLSEGRRPDHADRTRWANIAKAAQETIAPCIAAIDALAQRPD